MSDAPLIFTADQYTTQDNINVTRELRHMSPHDIIKWVYNTFGYDLVHLGSGYYADVFQHPTNPDYVIKVSNNSASTDAWILFAESIKGLNVPWFPEIKHLDIEYDCTVAVVEKLTEFLHPSDVDDPSLASDVEHVEIFETLINRIVVNRYMHDYSAIRMFRELSTSGLNGVSDSHLKQHWEMLRSCYKFFHELEQTHSFKEDIHAGNVMLRGNQFVITDPIC